MTGLRTTGSKPWAETPAKLAAFALTEDKRRARRRRSVKRIGLCTTGERPWTRPSARLAAIALMGLAMLAFASEANAASQPVWDVEASGPTYFVPSQHGIHETNLPGGALEAQVTNRGIDPANGVTITDKLPTGLKVVEMSQLPPEVQHAGKMTPVELYWCGIGVPAKVCGTGGEGVNLAVDCTTPTTVTGQEVVCTLSESVLTKLAEEYGGSGKVEPGQYLSLVTSVVLSSSASEGSISNVVSAEGGGAPSRASGESESTVSSHPTSAITKWSFHTTEAEPTQISRGHWSFVNRPAPFTQAGGHPDALTTTVEWANEEYLTEGGFTPAPIGNPKDVYVTLPQGLLGNPTAVPRCPIAQALFDTPKALTCPASTQVGVATVSIFQGENLTGPIYDITPEEGQSAEFLLTNDQKANFTLTAHVARVANPTTKRKEYSLQVDSNGIPNIGVYKVETTFWGEPASESHSAERGLTCERVTVADSWQCGHGGNAGNVPSGAPEIPFLTWQSDCSSGGERGLIESDSWEEPVEFQDDRVVSGSYASAEAPVAPATGCNLLSFSPSIGVEPDTLLADAPVGLGVNLTVPQFEEPERLATPELRKTVISLPPGLSVNPSVVDGVQACNEFGPEGINMEAPPSGADESEEVAQNGALRLAPGHCPNASKIGTAEAITPLLSEPIKGSVFLARPGCGNAALRQVPCTEQDALDGNLYKLYLELGGDGPLAKTGVNVKVRLNTEANPATGQLTSVAEEIAQLPFSELKIRLNGEPRAPLANPPACGSATTTADFSTWAAPGTTPEGVFMPGLADVTPSSFYNVDLADDGRATPCPNLPLNPGFVAGTVTPNAGKFSPFTMNISRKDGEQYVKGVQVHTPPGLLAVLASVPLCPETQANDPGVYGECTASKIGTTRVASGAGSHPFEIEGNVYLTGPHDGAPFGLSVVTHAVAGPFNLGLVVVRARIDIDPTNSTATITTDETGPYKLPQIIFGVPLRLQRITVNIDRPGFMFNPTNCKAQQIGANISGNQQAVAGVQSPFAVRACKSLAFKPEFAVSTNGHTSRKNGASLDAKVSYPKNAMGNDANISYVKVSLPKQLPSRLTTLQRACPAATFDANPSACSKESVVGIARTTTPLLPVQLQGPVYFVSHGGEAFPNLIVVLQGDGVRVDLVGDTFIDKAGITSSTFKTVPDVPVDSFELFLPQGRFSALGANENLCTATHTTTVTSKVTERVHGRTVHKTLTTRKRVAGLVMPTEFIGQNGAVFKQSTKMAVSGCAKAKAKGATTKNGRR